MIARVFIQIPFNFLIRVDEKFQIPSVDDFGYKISFFPPGRELFFVSNLEPSEIKINETEAILCNFIRIDFQKEEFNRPIHSDPKITSDLDPPIAILNTVLNFYIMRIRYFTKAPQIHPISIVSCPWRIEYLNDDGTELSEEKGKVRIKGSVNYELNAIPLNSEIWFDALSESIDLKSQNWYNLLLDGLDELPEIGPSIVLTYTGLEVFIAKILNKLATKDKISPEFWDWINNRLDWTQEPSVEEQYDVLLKNLTGHSLKEDKKLWEVFQNLKTARNTFVHEGEARLSKKSTKHLDKEKARELILLANAIPLRIREWLPMEIQWEEPKKYKLSYKVTWPLFGYQKENRENTTA